MLGVRVPLGRPREGGHSVGRGSRKDRRRVGGRERSRQGDMVEA